MQIMDELRICIFCRLKLLFSVLFLTNMAKSISYNIKHALLEYLKMIAWRDVR